MGEPAKRNGNLKVILWLVGIVIGLWLILGVANYYRFDKPEEASHFGESFGFVNTLFSALALAGVAVAIVLQMQELKLQRAELKLTRSELSKSAEAQAQLVHLSALSALLKSYLDEYTVRKEEVDREYGRLVRFYPEKLSTNLWYRILLCRAELEAVRNSGTRESAGAAVDASVQRLRIQLWITDLRNAAVECSQQTSPLVPTGSNYSNPPILLSAINTFSKHLDSLTKRASILNDPPVQDELTQIAQDVDRVQRAVNRTNSDYDRVRQATTQAMALAERLMKRFLEEGDNR